jgi:GMP synthase-like glutamine amidotransferase
MKLPDENKDQPNWLYSNDDFTDSYFGSGNLGNLFEGTKRTKLNAKSKIKMKILLVNNHTVHLKKLNQALAGHDVEVQLYKPGLDFHSEDKDLIILSGGGGQGLEIYDKFKRGTLWYQDQMDFILKTKKPILGICMGFEVITSTYGRRIDYLGKLNQGFYDIKTTTKGLKSLQKNQLKQFESHRWAVTDAPKDFEVLGESHTGVEIMRHKKRPIFATQFHPEAGGTLHLKNLLANT